MAAMTRSLFTLYYQPIIDTKTQKIQSAEALIRLIRDGELIGPNHFIPRAEKDGSIIEIDRWVLRKIPDDARMIFTKTFGEKIKISFNISAIHFNRDDFYENVIGMLNNAKDFRSSFEIEITESALIENIQNSVNTMGRLKEEGLRFALDDFGTGFASLKVFKNLPIDTIKLDKIFIDDMVDDKKTYAIVDSILYLAKNLAIETVAEGVEKIEQMEQLSAINCNEIQGYFYSKPLRLDDFILYLVSLNKPLKGNEFIHWSRGYSSNLVAFDSHHMILVNLLNTLYDILQNGRDEERFDIERYIGIIDNFISVHFSLEVRYMVKYNYPKIREHIMQHRRFVGKFQDLKETLFSANRQDVFNLFNFLKEWFIGHELKADKKLGHFIKRFISKRVGKIMLPLK